MRWFTQDQLDATGLGRPDKGGPMFVLLEYYVLDRIGHLPDGLSAKLDNAVPEVYDGGSSWIECVRYNFPVPPDEKLLAMWKRHRETASRDNRSPNAEEFARSLITPTGHFAIDKPSARLG